MKRVFILSAFIFSFVQAMSQSDSLKWAKEINQQVWKPFVSHFISGNQEGFRSLHSKDISRVEIDRNKLLDHDKYFPPIDPNAQQKKQTGERSFELRFDKRISNGTKAWESGYYKGTFTQDGKPPRSWYGRFFVVLTKENGTWKILVDADTGKEANEENFNKASAME